MKNIDELNSELAKVFKDLKHGKTEVKVASEMVNAAGKMINIQKVKLEYAQARKEVPDIDFLNN